MLRALVLLLVLANLGFYSWSQGWIDRLVGSHSQGDREPQRLAAQVHPEVVRILPASAASAVVASPLAAAASQPDAPVATACLEAGPFSALQLVAAQSSLRAASAPAVDDVTSEQPGVWIVYMGRYVNHEALVKKMEELRRRQLAFEEIKGAPELEPGLSLGRFPSQAAAEDMLREITRRSVHTARAVALTPPTTVHWLRAPQADAARQAQLLAIKAPALKEGFSACGTSPAAQAAASVGSPASAASSPEGAASAPAAITGSATSPAMAALSGGSAGSAAAVNAAASPTASQSPGASR